MKQIEELEQDAFPGTHADATEAGVLGEDFADAGTATFDRERDLSIRNNIRDLIDQVERALEHIADGTYGTCERCGKYIDAARLKALPHALMCLDCKRREERIR
jgi:RNA polymerase-binding protein DksA